MRDKAFFAINYLIKKSYSDLRHRGFPYKSIGDFPILYREFPYTFLEEKDA